MNLSVKSQIFYGVLKHILSVIFVKTLSAVTMHDHTTFQQQVVSETLCSAVYNNSGGTSNECDCQFLKYIFLGI